MLLQNITSLDLRLVSNCYKTKD